MRMGKADRLSKRLNWKVGVEKDNENQVVVKEGWLHSMQEVVIKGLEVVILEKIKKARSKDEDIVKIVEKMKKAGIKELWGNKWQIEGELVFKEGKVYVLKETELRVEIIWLHHDMPTAGYRGKWKTVELVTRNYWWLEVTSAIGRYVEGCDLCQKMKNRMEEMAGKLRLSEVLKKS